MDKETIALIIAQNGLNTASVILQAKAAKLEKQLAKVGDDKAAAAKLTKDINKTKKLSAALAAADEGIKAYMANSGDNS